MSNFETGSFHIVDTRKRQRMNNVTQNNLKQALDFFLLPKKERESQEVAFHISPELQGYIDESAHHIEGPLRTQDHIDALKKKNARIAAENAKREKEPSWLKEAREQADVDGKILERALLVLQATLMWLGDRVELKGAHEFDDKLHGTDLLMIIENDDTPDSPFILGLDVTVSKTDKILEEKMENIVSRVDNGTLTTIDYYQEDALQHEDQEASQPTVSLSETIPSALIALSPETFAELKKMTADFLAGNPPEAGEQLAEASTIPYAILESIVRQLDGFLKRMSASRRIKKDVNLPSTLQRMQDIRDALATQRDSIGSEQVLFSHRTEAGKEKIERGSRKRDLDSAQQMVSGLAA